MPVNENIVIHRNRCGLTQQEVADKAGISRAYYVNIEKGRRSGTVLVLKRIADTFGVCVDDFFKEPNDTNRNNVRTY